MKFETFKGILENLYNLLENGRNKNKAISEALGGDSNVYMDWYSKYVEDTINLISKDLNDDSELIDWFFWETECGNNKLTFSHKDKIYEPTYENIWKMINEFN